MTQAYKALLFLAIASSAVPSAASAQSREAAIERCRSTVGRPIVQACMRSRGATIESQRDLAACRVKATPQVRACVMAAVSGGRTRSGAGGGNGDILPVGHISDIPADFSSEGTFNPEDLAGAIIETTLSLDQTLAFQNGRRVFRKTETRLRLNLVSKDTIEMTRSRKSFDSRGKEVASEPSFVRTFKLGESVDTPVGRTIWTIEKGRLVNISSVQGGASRTIVDIRSGNDSSLCNVYFGFAREDGADKIVVNSLTPGIKMEVQNVRTASSDCSIKR